MTDRRGMQKRVLAVASAGGHWTQLRRLRPALEGMDAAFASVFPEYGSDVPGYRFYSFENVSRANGWKLPIVALQMVIILLRERPDVVITTGAGPGLVALALAKVLLRARTIWIDSIANCERLSTSGEHARRFADVWLTQWAHLAEDSGPAYWGAVL